jgi:hypothetical protein
MGMEATPWTPRESEGDGARAPLPDAVPVVVRAWTLLPTGEARPDVPTTGGLAATVKRDWSAFRADRFAAAWRALLRDGATGDTVERLRRAGTLVPLERR